MDTSRLSTYLTDSRILILITVCGGLAGIAANQVLENPFVASYPYMAVFAGTTAYLYQKYDIPIRRPRVTVNIRGATLCWILLSSASITAFHYAGDNRTLLVHALLLSIYAVALLTILSEYNFIGAGLAIGTGILHRGFMFYNSEIMVGNDSLHHNWGAGEIAARGDLSVLFFQKYYYTRVYHLLVSHDMLILSLDARHTAFTIVTVMYVVVPSLLIYCFIRRYYDWPTVGGLAVLFYVGGDATLGWSVMPQPTTLGVLLFAGVLYTTIRFLDTGDSRYQALSIGGYISLIFTHQVSSIITAFAITVLLISHSLQQEKFTGKTLLSFVYTILIGSFMFQKYSGPRGEHPDILSMLVLQLLTSPSTAESPALPESIDGVTSLVAGYSLIHVLGGAVFFGLGVFAFLHYSASRKSNSTYRHGLIVAGMYTVMFGGPLIGFSYLFPYRWQQYIYVLLAPLAALGLMRLSSVVPKPRLQVGSILVTMILLLSLMGGNYIGAVDEPIYDDANGAQRYSITQQEYALFNHISQTNAPETYVLGDFLTTVFIDRHFRVTSTAQFQVDYDEKGLTTPADRVLVVERPYVRTNHPGYHLEVNESIFRIYGSVPEYALTCAPQQVYDSGDNHTLRYSATGC